MDATNLNAELFRQLSYIANDEDSMRKAVNYIKKLVGQQKNAIPEVVAEDVVEYRSRTKTEILEGLDQSCKEYKQYKEGKLELKSLEELLGEL